MGGYSTPLPFVFFIAVAVAVSPIPEKKNPPFPLQSTNELRLKTVRLIGRQNLQIYKDQCWKGDANDITREYERNKAIGLKLGQWKQGVLVYDDDGLVRGILLRVP